MQIPDYVAKTLLTLETAGYEARLVGGCVRDALLGFVPQDYDICTNALPEQIKSCFPGMHLVLSGEKHGTVGVLLSGHEVEITTYRGERAYTDHRHPEKVVFLPSLTGDLSRRDFTVNAMAMDIRGTLFDPFDGERDLHHNILRTVGDPTARFEEDALRILRGLRFASRLGFSIDPPTARAMLACRELLQNISGERILSELRGLLLGPQAGSVLEAYGSVLTGAIPEIAPSLGFPHGNRHHIYDVWTHTCRAIVFSPVDFTVRMALLLHDLGKPQALYVQEGRRRFTGHPLISRRLAEGILARLHPPAVLREQVLFLVEHHDDVPPRTPEALGRFLLAHGEKMLLLLYAVMEGDALAHSDYGKASKLQVLEPSRALYAACRERGAAMDLGELAISGREILAAGVTPGPRVKLCLEHLFFRQLSGELPNTPAALKEALTSTLADGML